VERGRLVGLFRAGRGHSQTCQTCKDLDGGAAPRPSARRKTPLHQRLLGVPNNAAFGSSERIDCGGVEETLVASRSLIKALARHEEWTFQRMRRFGRAPPGPQRSYKQLARRASQNGLQPSTSGTQPLPRSSSKSSERRLISTLSGGPVAGAGDGWKTNRERKREYDY
jgi:hypothetical protein